MHPALWLNSAGEKEQSKDRAILRSVSRIRHAPRRNIRPSSQRIGGPILRLIRVTDGTRVGDLQQLRIFRRDELESVCSDICVGQLLLYLRHVARHAFVAGTSGGVMGVSLDGWRVGAVR